MNVKIQLLVTVRATGDSYSSAADLEGQVSSWIEAAIEDRDGIDTVDGGLDVAPVAYRKRAERQQALGAAERRYMLDAARGYSAKVSARRNLVTVDTVNKTLANAKRKLGASNITHAVTLCLASGEFTMRDIPEGN